MSNEKERILLLQSSDNHLNMMVTLMIENFGYEIATYESSDDKPWYSQIPTDHSPTINDHSWFDPIERFCENFKPVVILAYNVDLGDSGNTFCGEVRKRPTTKNIGLIILVKHEHYPSPIRPLPNKCLADEYIRRPVSPNELPSLVEKTIGKYKT
ncbi:MAG: hypothetical protein GY803_29270 [Chloroflexi bacterium]|nr:hypothetical protein [Chloroflexota bacterium]